MSWRTRIVVFVRHYRVARRYQGSRWIALQIAWGFATMRVGPLR